MFRLRLKLRSSDPVSSLDDDPRRRCGLGRDMSGAALEGEKLPGFALGVGLFDIVPVRFEITSRCFRAGEAF